MLIDCGTLARKGSSTVMMLQRRYPQASIVCVGGRYSRSSVLSALSLGVHGFIARSQSASQIRQAIDIVLNGGIYLPDLSSERSKFEIMPLSRDLGGQGDNEAAEQRYQEEFGLSPRQAVVLTLLSEGMTNKAIARHLDLAEATVKVHVSAIYRALNVRNRAGAVAVALSFSLSPGASGSLDRRAEIPDDFPAGR
ncbi:MAG: helix-turn-helix domain-containing protein [Limimaricola sp.]